MAIDLRYPIGKFERPESVPPDQLRAHIAGIRALPDRLRAVVAGLNEEQVATCYRPDGWTVRQVVHHLADSHMNSFIRFRLALTEDEPTIKPYDDKLWAELSDSRTAPIELSLSLIDALHARWVLMLESMDEAAFARRFRHPASGVLRLDVNLALYAWHSRHHVAHITSLRERMGW